MSQGAWGACCSATGISSVKLKTGAATSVPNTGAATLISFTAGSTEFTQGAALAADLPNSRITAAQAGIYVVIAAFDLDPTGSSSEMRARPSKNGTVSIDAQAFATGISSGGVPFPSEGGISTAVQLASGDSVSLIATHANGTGAGSAASATLVVVGPLPSIA